ncbi:YegS/Rv2252/BmrU family lipid kinase [Sporosarcina sp. USHLN248]|uniref:diacylglycerol/lipid kinase family protein n=1 Tax=Sporosarcina sp. USHLN248 TaxID=3081300 RepID=UPI003016E1F3
MYLFIINPASGNGRAFDKWSELQMMLRNKKIDYQFHICSSIVATNEFIERQCKLMTIKAIVIIGGDGTTHSVIQHLPYKNIPIAILPAGSGNDICRNFGLTNDTKTFIEKLFIADSEKVDVISVNGKIGLTVVGIGLDAMIGERADHSLYKKWLNMFNIGRFAYPIAAIFELLTFTPFQAKLLVDRQYIPTSKAWLIACGNTKKYGGGLKICPTADPANGKLALTLLDGAHRAKVLFSLFPQLLIGKTIQQKEVTYLSGKQFHIQTDRIIPVVIDGEILPTDNITIEILPQALQIIKTV